MSLLLMFFVICQAQPLTRGFVVEFEQKAVSPTLSFSINPDWHTLPGNAPDIYDNNGHKLRVSLTDEKRQRHNNVVKHPIFESISWQWLYTTHLLVSNELILRNKDVSLNSTPYTWLILEAVVAIGWLLRNYWPPDSPLFCPIEQQEATSMLTQRDHPFATIAMMFSSGQDQQESQPSESSGQQASQATSHFTGSFISLLFSDYDDNNGGPQQHQHTLGLNCFVHPCNGACSFRQSSDGEKPAESRCEQSDAPIQTTKIEIAQLGATANTGQSSYPDLTNKHYLSCISSSDPEKATHSLDNSLFQELQELSDSQFSLYFDQLVEPEPYVINGNLPNSCNHTDGVASDGVTSDGVAFTLGHLPAINNDFGFINEPFDPSSILEEAGFSLTLSHSAARQTNTEVFQPGQDQPHLFRTSSVQALLAQKIKENIEQKTCDVKVLGKDGQLQSCGKVYKDTLSLSSHKSKYHTGQKSCDITIVVDGQPRPCGAVFKHAQSLSSHKSRFHKWQITCDMTVVGEDGQHRPCKKVCKSPHVLSGHKRKDHSGQQTCDETVVGEDGQPKPCRTSCRNASALSTHKSKYHTGKQTCYVSVDGENGLPQPCKKIYKSTKALADHKRKDHSGLQTCDLAVIGQDGQQRPCGTVCKNIEVLLCHKRKEHTGQQTCSIILIGKDGQLRQCGKICRNTKAFSDHKRIHRKRKPVDVNKDDDPNP
ncbi:hypothetical protein [Endozoicomonas sp. SESOKO2]|uniref:hypothetical protein n=1 Tax=Endozoicomonas sp. SESOKO2 TaxID=2828743 RepID=UPI002148D5CC|nr:hypothetical protein [Endozoicomonas sp. SESOKO2]